MGERKGEERKGKEGKIMLLGRCCVGSTFVHFFCLFLRLGGGSWMGEFPGLPCLFGLRWGIGEGGRDLGSHCA